MKARQFTKTSASSATPEALTQRAVTSITRSGLTCTVITAEAHQYVAGDAVLFSGADQAEYNRLFQIASVTNTTTFVFLLAQAPATLSTLPASPATGTVVCVGRIEAIKAIIQPGKGAGGRSANTGFTYVGNSSTNDTQPNAFTAATDVMVVEPGVGKYFNLGDYYLDVATNGDGVLVQFWPRI